MAICRPPKHSLIVTDVPLRPDDAPYLDSPTRAGRLSLNVLKQGWGARELDLGVTEGGLLFIVSLMLTLIMLVVTVGTPRRSACVAGRIHLSQTPAQSVFLTPAPESMPVDHDSDNDTIVETDIENPFIEQHPSSSSQIDYSLSVTPGNEQAQPQMTDKLTTNKLMTTDYLNRFDLAFNRKYNLIICQPCGAGIPLSSTHSHLESTRVKRIIWQEHIGSWKHTLVVLPHQPSVRMLPSRAKLIKNITESLKATGLVEDESVILDIKTSADWYLSLPTPDLGPAILGLRVFHGTLQCHVCDKLYLSAVGLQSHYSKAKHGSSTNAHHSKTVQTLTEHHSSYFEVIDTEFYPPSHSLPPTFPSAAFLTFAGASVLDQVVPLADPGCPGGTIKFSLEVIHLVRLLVEAEDKVLDNATGIPWDIAIIAVGNVDPQALGPVYQFGCIWGTLSSKGPSRFAIVP